MDLNRRGNEKDLSVPDATKGNGNPFGLSEKFKEMPKTGPGHSESVCKKPISGPAGELVPLGMADGKLPNSLVGNVKRYLRNVCTAIFKPTEIFAPVKIKMAGGKLQYTLSEDVRKIRGEAYDAGLRAGKRGTKKLERYVEGDGSVKAGTALQIFERGQKHGYNNGFTDGRNERAELMEEALGTFEDLEEYYDKGPDDVLALIGKKFVKVYDHDDAISLYKRRYGDDETRKMLIKEIVRNKEKLAEDMISAERTKPELPGKVESV